MADEPETALVPPDSPEEDLGLSERQINALDRLNELGGKPRESDDAPYDSDPQIRAYQMVYEGRIGGRRPGQGRPRKVRAAEGIAEWTRKNEEKYINVLERALDDPDNRIALKAFEAGMTVERREAELQIKEDEIDTDNISKEELIATLFQLASDPAISAGVQPYFELPSGEVEEITDAEEVREPKKQKRKANKRNRASSAASTNGVDSGKARRNGRGSASHNGGAVPNPFKTAKIRRSSN